MTKIYLACPWSHPVKAVRYDRWRAVTRRFAELVSTGLLVFSPITMTHHAAEDYRLPGGWAFWKAFDSSFIEWCDELWVLTLPGWKESKGVAAEVSIAEIMGKPVVYVAPSDAKPAN